MFYLSAGFYDGSLHGWHASSVNEEMKLIYSFVTNSENNSVRAVKIQNDLDGKRGNKLYMGMGDSESVVKLYDLEKRKELADLSEHDGIITCIDFCDENRYMLTGDDRGKLCLWRLKDYNLLHIFKGHKDGPIVSMSVHPSSKLLISTSKDNSLRLWNLETGKAISRQKILKCKYINCIQFEPTIGDVYAIVGDERKLMVFDLNSEEVEDSVKGLILKMDLRSRINDLCFISVNQIAIGSDDGLLRVIDIKKKEIVKEIDYSEENVYIRVKQIVHTTNCLIVGLSNGKILLYNNKYDVQQEIKANTEAHLTCLSAYELNNEDKEPKKKRKKKKQKKN